MTYRNGWFILTTIGNLTNKSLMAYIIRLASVFVIIASTKTLNDDTQTLKDPCQLRYCNDMSSESDINCSCEDSCWRRRGCCLNYLNQTNVDNQTYYFDTAKEVIKKGMLYQCHVINLYRTTSYFVISKCMDSGNANTESWKWQKSQCEKEIQHENVEDILLTVPVSSNNSGETYKNIYCAACNNDLDDTVFWNTNVVCPDESQVSNLTEALQNLYVNNRNQQPTCRLEVVQPNEIKTFRCSVTSSVEIPVNACPQSFSEMNSSLEDGDKRREIEWLCQVTNNKININRINYRNPYCAACHFNETDVGAVINSKHGFCSKFIFDMTFPSPGSGMQKSFAVLLDIDFSNKGNMVGLTYHCPSGSIYDVFTKKCRLLVCSTKPRYQYHDGQCEKPGEIEKTEFIGGNFSSDHSHKILTENETVVNISNCHKMRLQRLEFVINENGTLTAHQQKLYPEGSFELIDNDTVNVCVDLSDNYVFNYESDIHRYMTIICSALSLFALLLKMTIFAFIPKIRKFPDKLVFCLCASLFMAQLLFLTPISSITNYPVCVSFGVLTHYFFLCSFCWMNVLAYDIWITLSRCIESRFIHPDILKCRFYCYSMYAWVTPMLIVSAACVFEWSGVVDEYSIMRPHYGVNLCWINTRSALLFYFAIPMALLLLTNIVFFVLTAVSICRSSIASSKVKLTENSKNCCHNHNRSHHLRFSIHVRLAVIMGLTWISGFVAAVSGQEWLWYLFTITNASQGVYILISLTSFKKVLHILQCRFQMQGNNSFSMTVMNLNEGNYSNQA